MLMIGLTLGWMDGWMDGWVDGWVDGWMDGWMEQAQIKKASSCACQPTPEVTPYHSGSLSHH